MQAEARVLAAERGRPRHKKKGQASRIVKIDSASVCINSRLLIVNTIYIYLSIYIFCVDRGVFKGSAVSSLIV